MNGNATQINVGAASQLAGQAIEPIMAGQAARQQYRVHNSRLPDDAWREMDELMVDVSQERLNLFDRLRQRGLIDSVGLGDTISTWQETNAFDEADVSMDGRSDSDEDASVYATKGVPVPLITKGFRLGHREIDSASDVRDSGIDKSTRAVIEKVEDFIVEGWSQPITDARGDEFQIYGVTNHPDRGNHAGSSWGTASNVDPDVRSMISTAKDNNYFGPYDLWIAGEQDDQLLAPSPDFDNMRLRQQIAELAEINEVVVSDRLPDGEAVLVQLTRDVVDAKLVNGNAADVAEWNNTPMETIAKVFSGFAPRVKSDMGEDGTRQAGLVHATGLS